MKFEIVPLDLADANAFVMTQLQDKLRWEREAA